MQRAPWGTSPCSWTRMTRAGRCTRQTFSTISGALKWRDFFQGSHTRSELWPQTTKETVRTVRRPLLLQLVLRVSVTCYARNINSTCTKRFCLASLLLCKLTCQLLDNEGCQGKFVGGGIYLGTGHSSSKTLFRLFVYFCYYYLFT